MSDYCRRALPRWRTRFGRFVAEVGVPEIHKALRNHPDPEVRVTKGAIYEWLQGHRPSPDRARALVELSRGRLSLDAIYSHRRERDRLVREESQEGDGRG